MSVVIEKLQDKLVDFVEEYGNPDRKSNTGQALHEIWMWQEIAAFAKKAEDGAWKKAQADSIIPTDDELRSESGEGIVADSDHYSCVVKTEAPRQNFDRDMFVAAVAAAFNIPAAKLLKFVDKAKKESTAPLKKSIVIVEPKKGKR